MVKFLDRFKGKKEYKMNTEGMELPKTLGYINPLWSVTASYKGEKLFELPLFFIIATYLKDYGFEPEKKVEPPICVTIDIGGPLVKFPLTTKEEVKFGQKYTAEMALEKGLLYKSHPRS